MGVTVNYKLVNTDEKIFIFKINETTNVRHYSFENNFQDHLERTNDDEWLCCRAFDVVNIFQTLYKSMGYTYVFYSYILHKLLV